MENGFNLYLVRHGESFNNSVPEPQRVNDPPLTDLGHAQATCLAERMKQQFGHASEDNQQDYLPLDKLYTSAFLRTMQTIHPATKLTARQPEIWTDLFEVGGCFDGYQVGQTRGMPGMTRDEIDQQFAGYKIPQDIDHNGWWKSKPRETREQADSRAQQVAQTLCDQFLGKRISVLCVIHADLIRLLMKNLAPKLSEYSSAIVHNTSLTHLHFADAKNDGSPEVVLFDDTSHLKTSQLSV